MIRRNLQEGATRRLRTILRFDAQNTTWNLVDWERYSNAWAYGLMEMGLTSTSRLMCWVGEHHTTELAALIIGSSKLGVEVCCVDKELSVGGNFSPAKLGNLIAGYQPDAFVFSPHQLFEGRRKEEVVSTLTLKDLPLIHTGLYSKAGMLRFRDVLLFRNRHFSHLPDIDYDANLAKVVGDTPTPLPETYEGPFNDYPRLLGVLVRAALEGVFVRVSFPGSELPKAEEISLQARTLLERTEDSEVRHLLSHNSI